MSWEPVRIARGSIRQCSMLPWCQLAVEQSPPCMPSGQTDMRGTILPPSPPLSFPLPLTSFLHSLFFLSDSKQQNNMANSVKKSPLANPGCWSSFHSRRLQLPPRPDTPGHDHTPCKPPMCVLWITTWYLGPFWYRPTSILLPAMRRVNLI